MKISYKIKKKTNQHYFSKVRLDLNCKKERKCTAKVMDMGSSRILEKIQKHLVLNVEQKL